MNGRRTFYVILKDPQRAPVGAADIDTARIGLAQEASRAGYILVDPPSIQSSGYNQDDRLYEATFAAAARMLWDSNTRGCRISSETRMSLRAHRSALHAVTVLTGAVCDVLESRDPKAAAIVLHMLGCPGRPGDTLGRSIAIGAATLPMLWPTGDEHQDHDAGPSGSTG